MVRLRLAKLFPSRSTAVIICLGVTLTVGIPFYCALWWAQYGPSHPDLIKYIAHRHPILSSSPHLVDAPPPILSVLRSTSPLVLAPPSPLPSPVCPPTGTEPLLLAIHIFSSAKYGGKPPKHRRDVIRRTIKMGIPHTYRHLVDVRFILGRSWDPSQEVVNDKEETRKGDLIRMNIPDGDGERGKAAEWLSVIGRGRVAQWVIKCEADTLPILPNLIPFLLTLDPEKPTIIGSSFHTNRTNFPQLSKRMYGFSWGVVKAISDANMTDDEKNLEIDEEAYIGGLMHSLPSRPGREDVQPAGRVRPYPPSPDPRTGLVWADVGRRISPWGDYWQSGGADALAYYGIDEDQFYEENAIGQVIKDLHAAGRRYLWQVPDGLKYLKCPLHYP